MDSYTSLRIERVPRAALLAIHEAGRRARVNRSIVIDWGLKCLGLALPAGQLYWRPAGSNRLTPVPLVALTGKGFTNITVFITEAAEESLSHNQWRFVTSDGFVVARAAQLAQYYGRTDGQLGYGPEATERRVPTISMVRFIR